jgi:uncharacterized protein (PEP-CTERM system associated)
MTITTAEPLVGLRGAAAMPAALKLAPLALAAMLLSAECRADWQFKPTATLRETYTDNVALQRDELARNEFITEAAPGFSLTSNGPRLNLAANAQWSRFVYSDKDASNIYDSARRYQASARAMVVDDLLYIDGAASGQRQAISAFGQLGDNQFSRLNNTDISTWRISPYVQHRFGATASANVRFTRDSVEASNNAFGNSVASSVAANVASGPAFTNLGWNLSYYHQDLNNRIAGSSASENATLGLRYRLIPHLSVTASGGYDDYEYAALGERTAGRSWNAGFAWTPSTRTSVEASFGHRYFGKTGALNASYRTPHSVWSMVYSDQVTTTRSQFTLPSAIDTASMLDRLFAASFPDPVQRQQVVQAYIASTGLPPSLADSVNYLSNRYIRAKRLQGAAVLRGARSSLTLSVFRDERVALSLQQSDSGLLGSQLASLNDNVRQRGASIDADYRLSPRTSASATFLLTRAQSIGNDIVNNNRQLRLGMTRRFSDKTSGILELRHVRGNPGITSSDVYHENAVVATLSVQY